MAADETDEALDELLRDHFRRELDPQVGRVAPPRVDHPPMRRLWIGRVGFWVAGAIAASLTIAWGVTARFAPVAHLPAKPILATTTGSASLDLVPIEQVVHTQALDEGTVVTDDAGPARQVRQEEWETTTFYDEQSHAHVELTVPRERVMLIEMQTY